MNRDPLYTKIMSALKRPLDPLAFQRCATDLLREAYPTLAPLVGGDDAGMDGAIGYKSGAFPLVCTTSPDVIRNLTTSLTENRKKWHTARCVVVATSQKPTNRQRLNLKEKAESLGYKLVNLHDRIYFADLLYSNAHWRMELLGIPGNAPALSILPRRFRNPAASQLIGRDPELDWLRHAAGDVLVVGQPGSGKTSLHQNLAREGKCLFAVDGDLGRLSDAVREQRPTTIVLDDAHFDLDLLTHLYRLRHELGFRYAIHANCWPGYEKEIRTLLDLSDTQVRLLDRLPRQMILEVVQNCGIRGPDELLQFLLRQADGKPGLAVALAEATRRDGVKRLWSGELLADQLARLIETDRHRSVLAAIALGGDFGMTLEDVAAALSLSPVDVRQITSGLGAGGVIETVGERRLQVRPPALRAVLVRDVFFSDAHSLNPHVLLEKSNSAKDTAGVLMNARQIGADVSQEVIDRFVRSANDADCWEHYGWVNEECAHRVVASFSDHICEAAPGVLHFRPKDALPLLLEADRQTRIHRGAVESPRRRIEEWLVQERDPPGATVERRGQLLSAVREWRSRCKEGTDDTTAWALRTVLSPNFRFAKQKPGSGLEYELTFHVLSESDLKGIIQLWPQVREGIAELPVGVWTEIINAIENWCFPGRHERTKPLPKQVCRVLRVGSRTMLSDLVSLPSSTRAVRQWVSHVSKITDLRVRIDVEPLLRLLFDDPRLDDEANRRLRDRKLTKLAITLALEPPKKVASMLAEIEKEFAEFPHCHGGWDRYLVYQRLSETYEDSVEWLAASIDSRLPSRCVEIAMRIAFHRDFDRANPRISALIDDQNYGAAAANLVLLSDRFDDGQFQKAVQRVSSENHDLGWLHWTTCPSRTIVALLGHSNKGVRTVVALAEWTRTSGSVCPEVTALWREAILDIDEDNHSLSTILASDPELAFNWMKRRFIGSRWNLWRLEKTAKEVAKSLTRSQRGLLLALFTKENFSSEWFDSLLNGDVELFRDWLGDQSDRYLKFRPLDRTIGQEWVNLAVVALDAGCTPSEIADYAIPRSVGGMGPLSEHFRALIPVYEELLRHPDRRLHPAAQAGLKWVAHSVEHEQERERRASIFGE